MLELPGSFYKLQKLVRLAYMYLRESRHIFLLPVRRRTAVISRPECLTHTQLDSIVSSATRRYKQHRFG
jgi:hypothetical protein